MILQQQSVPQTKSSSRNLRNNPGAPSLMDLPSEVHVYLISFLDFRDLQMLRATSTYFHELPTDAELARARPGYVQTLQKLEVDEVQRAIRADGTISPSDETHKYLTCYTCFRRLHISNFTTTQISRRRTKGHADAHKRFCKDCAIRGKKWEPGIILSFPDRDTIYCRRCRDVSAPPHNEWLRVFGLCEGCRVRTGIPDLHPPKEGVPAAAWYEMRRRVDELYGRYSHARIPLPEAEWKQLEEELRMLQLDEELLSSPM